MRVATKAGLARTGPGQWIALGRPEYLIQQAHKSLRNLGVERIDLWQLHRIDPKVPADEQFGAVKELLDQGLIRHAGLSEVSVQQHQGGLEVLQRWRRCRTATTSPSGAATTCSLTAPSHAIGFIPWYPLAAGALARAGAAHETIEKIAKRHGATPSQIVLAWTLRKSPVMLPIPGTSRVDHLEENVAAARIVLADAEMAALDDLPRD